MAEMNEQNDLIHFLGKAETLLRVQSMVTKSKICDQITSVWKDCLHPDRVIKEVQSKFQDQQLIFAQVRLKKMAGKQQTPEYLKVF